MVNNHYYTGCIYSVLFGDEDNKLTEDIMSGKGSTPRPVDKKRYDKGFDDIDWGARAREKKEKDEINGKDKS